MHHLQLHPLYIELYVNLEHFVEIQQHYYQQLLVYHNFENIWKKLNRLIYTGIIIRLILPFGPFQNSKVKKTNKLISYQYNNN